MVHTYRDASVVAGGRVCVGVRHEVWRRDAVDPLLAVVVAVVGHAAQEGGAAHLLAVERHLLGEWVDAD